MERRHRGPFKPRATAPPAWELDFESTVRDQLYGKRVKVSATPIRRGPPAAAGARYRLLERLDSGATAAVYRARDERLQRDVAVKIIAERRAHDSASVRRFRREAELCARLAHANVAGVLDAGRRPRDYIVMELVKGHDVATLLSQDQPLTTARAVDVIVQICEALEHAHRRGVIHCDVSPRNVRISQRDGTVKLVDFGSAIDTFRAREWSEIMGTPGYVAPEVIRGGGPSPHSDLYSLAVVAYRLLGGPAPLVRHDQEETVGRPSAISNLPALAEVRPDVPRLLTAVVERAMASVPAARPASVAEFRDLLLKTQAGRAQLLAA